MDDKTTKKTSPALAKIAGKYVTLDDCEMALEMGLTSLLAGGLDTARFFRNVRALAASVLSQSEPKKATRRASK